MAFGIFRPLNEKKGPSPFLIGGFLLPNEPGALRSGDTSVSPEGASAAPARATTAPRSLRAAFTTALLALALAFGATALAGCSDATNDDAADGPTAPSAADVSSVPAYTGSPYILINDDEPSFTDEEIAEAGAAADANAGFERYSDLDALGRCGAAFACIGPETRPTEERGDIHEIHPTGWEQEFYEFVEDPGDGEEEAVYNRCHLIAFSLSGENANERNLITGTHYMNTEGMLPFENSINRYIDRTDNHVLYRVTPVFVGDELVARGVHMEARSVEDDGEGVSFNIYCYNVQPRVTIDYATGENWETPDQGIDDTGNAVEDDASATDGETGSYVLNDNSMKFHRADCESVADIAESNRTHYEGSRQALIDAGYEPCGACNP